MTLTKNPSILSFSVCKEGQCMLQTHGPSVDWLAPLRGRRTWGILEIAQWATACYGYTVEQVNRAAQDVARFESVRTFCYLPAIRSNTEAGTLSAAGLHVHMTKCFHSSQPAFKLSYPHCLFVRHNRHVCTRLRLAPQCHAFA